MKNSELMNKMSRGLHKMAFGLKKRSPEILVAIGIAGAVASAVMACKATTKIDDILEETKDKLDKIQECADNSDMEDEYSADDAKKDTAIVYAHTGVKLAKLIAGP